MQSSSHGWGILFFWQLGILQHLRAECDLRRVHWIGSSAGSLIAVLGACSVDPQEAVLRAHALCEECGVATRPLGLAGIWGGLVRRWLLELLPPDAAERCSGRVSVVVTQLPWLTSATVSTFESKESLVEACLASCHIPFFLDGHPWARFGGGLCIDGSFCYILFRRTLGLVPPRVASLLMFEPWADMQLRSSWSLKQCVELLGLPGAQRLMRHGSEFARALQAQGRLPLAQAPAR